VRTHRPTPAIALLLGAALIAAGCGDDKSDMTSAAEPTTTATAPIQPSGSDAPLQIDDVRKRLDAAGYDVEKKRGQPLIRNASSRGGIVKSATELVVTGGDLPSGADVRIHSLSSPVDEGAMERFAGGGRSLVKGKLFFQASEQGLAEQVARAAGG
jgi:hypothetical protein